MISRWLKTCLLDSLYCLVLTYFSVKGLWRIRRDPAFFRGYWSKIFGCRPQLDDGRPIVWFHAVCVGETLSCRPIIDRVSKERPDLKCVLSVSTPQGMEVAVKEFPDIDIFWAPFDFSWAIKRVFSALRPRCLAIAENDFWSHQLQQAAKTNTPVAVFNTRMNDLEFREHRLTRFLLGSSVQAITWWSVETDEYAQRIQTLYDYSESRLTVTGSLKQNGRISDRNTIEVVALKKQLDVGDDEVVLVAGSTHEPEEQILLDILLELQQIEPKLRLVLAPRDVHRFETVADLVKSKGFACRRLSQPGPETAEKNSVDLIDTIGDLRHAWGLASFAFVGGSLAHHGGHNVIEPASYGLPICFGPHVWNFEQVIKDILNADGAVLVNDASQLKQTLTMWITDPGQATAVGDRARQFVQAHNQSVSLIVDGIHTLLPELHENGC